MPTATLGLTTYRRNNNLKSIVLLAAFPVLLLALVGATFFLFGLAVGQENPEAPGAFQNFGLQPVLGTGSPGDFAVSAMVAYLPIVFGVAAICLLIVYFFNDAIIHAATAAMPVTREAQPQLYNLLE